MEKPIVVAFLLADKVFREMETGKVHIAGTFNQLAAVNYPMTHPQFHAYLGLTELKEGEHRVKIELSYFDTGYKILNVDQLIQSPGPLEVLELNMCFNRVSFPEPGDAQILVSLNDTILLSRKLVLKKLEMK